MAREEKDDGGPAFPNTVETRLGGDGMSLRDWFAGQALQFTSSVKEGAIDDSILTRLFGKDRTDITGREVAAALAYELADAMLEARRK